jgi:hypothetical protein
MYILNISYTCVRFMYIWYFNEEEEEVPDAPAGLRRQAPGAL